VLNRVAPFVGDAGLWAVVPEGKSKYPVDVFTWSLTAAGVTDAAAEDTHAEPLDVRTLPAVPGVVKPVPPAAAGNVPAAKAELEVEYSALFAPVKVVKPVPP
jgi:hypothetical protein